MSKYAAPVLVIVALVAVMALLLTGGDPEGAVGFDGTATVAPASTADGPPMPLQPAALPAPSGDGRPDGANGGARPVPGAGAGSGPATPPTPGHVLTNGERVSGVVRSPGGHAAVRAAVTLTVRTTEGLKALKGWTDEQGVFSFASPGEGSAWIEVRASGLATMALPVGSDAPIEVEPPPAVQITGVVRTDDGDPLPGAFVNAYPVGGDPAVEREVAQTGPDGAFVLGALLRGRRYRLEANHANHPASAPLEAEAPTTGATLTLYEGATLVVTVFDADGGVLTNESANGQQPGWQSFRSYAEVHGPTGSRTLSNWSTANPEQFELTGLAPGAYRVVVQARGHGRVERDGISVPRVGTTQTEVRLGRGGYARVEVVDEEGTPVPSVTVVPAGLAGTPFGLLVQDESGSEGIARVGPLPDGAAKLQVWASGFESTVVDATIADGLEIALRVVFKRRK